ncbi:hypothetical protein ACEWY4_019317 [Coilia grayii]|uniref:ADP-ribosyl cyclase/cyclic ADP-ribose hydrolase n=1 Tax=Coilia grayii TaxID=363190 RepID=A0ABD1JFR6_9TELE
MQAFVGRDPCDVPPEAYDSLMDTAPRNPACNRTLFWSKTKDIVHAFTEKRNCYLTLEDTALGSILDGLIWCGKNDSQETLTTACPGWSDCVNNPVRSFWKRASVAVSAFCPY